MVVSVTSSRIEGSNSLRRKRAFDISLMANIIDNSSFDHVLKSRLNISTCKE